jgi:hypothetical protein
MIVEFDSSFEKALNKLQEKSLYLKIENAISVLEECNSLAELSDVKKISWF